MAVSICSADLRWIKLRTGPTLPGATVQLAGAQQRLRIVMMRTDRQNSPRMSSGELTVTRNDFQVSVRVMCWTLCQATGAGLRDGGSKVSTTESLPWASGSQFKVVRLSEVDMGHFRSQRRGQPRGDEPRDNPPK